MTNLDNDPKSILDWLIVQHTCERCGGTIDCHDAEGHWRTPTAVWGCFTEKRHGYTSKHWRYWRVCTQCYVKHGFGQWIFPLIADMPEHLSLDSFIQVQPMDGPSANVFYLDFISDREHEQDDAALHGRREHVVMLDEACLRAVSDSFVTFTYTLTHSDAVFSPVIDPA